MIGIEYDKTFRANLLKNPHRYAKELGYNVTSDQEIVVKVADEDVMYLAIPRQNDALESNLEQIQAAATASTSGTLSTTGTFFSCLGSASCMSTLGSAGTD